MLNGVTDSVLEGAAADTGKLGRGGATGVELVDAAGVRTLGAARHLLGGLAASCFGAWYRKITSESVETSLSRFDPFRISGDVYGLRRRRAQLPDGPLCIGVCTPCAGVALRDFSRREVCRLLSSAD